MNILDSLRGILEEIMPYVDPQTITYETRLREDLGMSDMALTATAMTVEARFGFAFPRESGLQTVGDIAAYIEKYESYEMMEE